MPKNVGTPIIPPYVAKPISTLVEKIEKFKPGKPLLGYITHIRFPNFKNIAPGTQIKFEFPIAALVGPNGSGKTSVIHALYGAPLKASVSDFWFSTPLDPIISRQDNPPRFIYGHYHSMVGTIVETRKAQVGQDIDYWEPTKEVAEDGMAVGYTKQPTPPGRSKDRWNPVAREVLYLNFRSELSAFDKYLFFGSLKQTVTLRSKQARLRVWSKAIVTALESNRKTVRLRKNGKNLMHEIFDLEPDELAAVRYILGKKYQSAKYIEHSIYGQQRGVSVRFRGRRGQDYSEAFAGSGEMAIVALVAQIYRAKQGTLILLDEPEVSLHPGAQERLLEVILEQVAKNFHQVVFSTHSPAMVRHLPMSAIKLFVENEKGKFEVVENVYSATAFGHLGEPVSKKINIYVEDRLTKLIVELVLRLNFTEQEAALFEISYFSGGAQTYFGLRIPTLMHRSEQIYFILDGDVKPPRGFPDPDSIPPNQHSKLGQIIKDCTGVEKVQYGIDGGSDPEAKLRRSQVQRKYLKYLNDRVNFLPKPTAEQLVLSALGITKGELKLSDAKDRLRAAVAAEYMPTQTYEQTEVGAIALLSAEYKAKGALPELDSIAEILREIRLKVGNQI